MSCRDCVFKGIFQDMGASSDVCNLQSNLVDAIKACENSENCRHRFTVEEAKRIVIEREGGSPVIARNEDEKIKWISVDDRLPEKSGEVLVYKPNYMCVLDYSRKHQAFNAFDDLESVDYAIEVTHWMPLPKPPKEC